MADFGCMDSQKLEEPSFKNYTGFTQYLKGEPPTQTMKKQEGHEQAYYRMKKVHLKNLHTGRI